jgi:uncharacterized membrane protein YbhN (UPF0104 family)
MCLKATISVLVIALLLSRADLAGVGASLAAASMSGLALSCLAFLLVPVLGGLRWHLALRGIGERSDLTATTIIFGTATIAGQILPSVAGDALRVFLATRAGHGVREAARSVLLERAFMIMGVLGLLLITAPMLANSLADTGVVWLGAALFGCGLAAFAVLLAADYAPYRLRRLPPWQLLAGTAPAARRLTFSSNGAMLVGASLAGNLNFALAGFLLAKALGLHVTAWDMIVVMPTVTFATTLPISLGGWGMREGAMVVLLGRFGVPSAGALSLSLLFGAFGMISGLPFLFAWVTARQQLICRAAKPRAALSYARLGQ